MPPLRWMNWSSGSASGLYAAAYRTARLHLGPLVSLGRIRGTRRMTAAKGPRPHRRRPKPRKGDAAPRQNVVLRQWQPRCVKPRISRSVRREAQAGDQMALEPEGVPDRDGFSCFSGVVGGLQEAHDLRRSSPASNAPAVEGRSTRRWALPK
jgi:hypothetical protein